MGGGVGLGEYRNIRHAKEILSAMFLQSGTPMARKGAAGYRATLEDSGTAAVVDFYTEFSNSEKPVYSWNRSFSDSRSAFTSDRLGMYFGLASELPDLETANPNLNFGVALLPVPVGSKIGITYGKLSGAAILRTSPRFASAFEVALKLSGAEASALWAQTSGLPPARRDLLARKPSSDSEQSVFYDSAIRSRGWLDPHRDGSDAVFKNMIESITGGRTRSAEALANANRELTLLFR